MRTVTLVMLLHVLAMAAGTLHQKEWEEWKKTYNKVYKSSAEETRRRSIWEENKAVVEEHNRQTRNHEFTLGMNKFADRDELEMGLRGGLLQEKLTPQEILKHMVQARNFRGSISESIDWRDKGAVLAVKEQKNCGSCWSFAITGAIEGQNYIKHNSTMPLSEQNIIDCSWKFGNHGCNGGNAKKAYEYLISNDGIEVEEHYPYTATDIAECQYNSSFKGATITDYVYLPSGDEETLTNAIATIGPIGVSIDASMKTFHFYNGTGVFYGTNCSSVNHNHMVLAVGYGTENGRDYYLVKNSWGTSWGAEGYIKMARNRNNNCGIATLASYPIM